MEKYQLDITKMCSKFGLKLINQQKNKMNILKKIDRFLYKLFYGYPDPVWEFCHNRNFIITIIGDYGLWYYIETTLVCSDSTMEQVWAFDPETVPKKVVDKLLKLSTCKGIDHH